MSEDGCTATHVRLGRVLDKPRAGRGRFVGVSPARHCSRAACRQPAVATLTYVYADSTAVLGPLSRAAEPHSYDLCAQHANRLTAPRGWEVVRLAVEYTVPEPTGDDLTALAEAVREAARPRHKAVAEQVQVIEVARRGHLRVLRGEG